MKSTFRSGVGLSVSLLLLPVSALADRAYDLPSGFSEVQPIPCSPNRSVQYQNFRFDCQYETESIDGIRYIVLNNWATSSQAEHKAMIARRTSGNTHEIVGVLDARGGFEVARGPNGQVVVLAIDLRTSPQYTVYEVNFNSNAEKRNGWKLDVHELAILDENLPSSEADSFGEVYKCEVKVAQANVRTAPNGNVTSTLPRGAVIYLYRTEEINGVKWHEMVTFDAEAGVRKKLGFMADSTLICWGLELP